HVGTCCATSNTSWQPALSNTMPSAAPSRASHCSRIASATSVRSSGVNAEFRSSLVATVSHCCAPHSCAVAARSEEHTSELQSRFDLVCRLLLEKKTSKE